MPPDHDAIAVFVGIDVGKTVHHVVAQDRLGTRLVDQAVANAEPALRDVLAPLAAHGPVLVVVDQPATIGALPVRWRRR